MSLDELIARTAACGKCGTVGVGNCRCWIRLKCERCGKAMTVERLPIDPPTAEMCVTAWCNTCEREGESDGISYYDASGKEISGDPEGEK